jgi:hypothetical protein
MLEEVDWTDISEKLADKIEEIDMLSEELCGAKWFKACIAINEKVVPVLKQLKHEADARAKAAELALESEGEEEGELVEERLEEEGEEE